MNRIDAFHQLFLKAEASAGFALLMEVKTLAIFCDNKEKISNYLLHGFLAKKSDLCFFKTLPFCNAAQVGTQPFGSEYNQIK